MRRSWPTRCASCSTASSTGSSAPGRGSSRRRGSPRYEADLRARIAAADPIDPGVPLPADAWAADVLPLLPFERRGSKLYLPGAVATLEGREAEAEALERELADAGVRATKVSDDELARFLEASGRLVRLGDGYAIGADAFDVAKDVLLAECHAAGEISLARFRDLSARDAATRSSCSSASTPTGSRVASVSGVSCGDRLRAGRPCDRPALPLPGHATAIGASTSAARCVSFTAKSQSARSRGERSALR